MAAIGDMAQATVLYDSADRPVFTIFKEQRIEVPLSHVSPNLIKAVLSVEDQRFFEHVGVDVIRILGAMRCERPPPAAHAGRQHDHAAAGAPELSDARADADAQAEGSHLSPR